MKSGARRPDILIGGVGDMQFYPKNENTPDFSDLTTLLVLNVPKSLKSANSRGSYITFLLTYNDLYGIYHCFGTSRQHGRNNMGKYFLMPHEFCLWVDLSAIVCRMPLSRLQAFLSIDNDKLTNSDQT